MKYLLIFFLILIPAIFSMTKPGYFIMHDDMQMIRQLQMEKCFEDGQIPCRWGPDLGYGYGYPIFNFYPPLPYLIGHVVRYFGYSFVETVKINAILQFFVSAVGIFFLIKKITNSKIGLLAGTLYTYAPYHFNNIYIRGAFNEAWASSFFPFALLFIIKITEKASARNIIFLALSIASILLSHNPMAMLFAPLAGIWSIYWILKNKNLKSIFGLIIGGILGLGLSSYYTLPVLFETKFVQIETMFSNYYSYVAHFTSIKQLFFTNFWGNGPSFFGPKDSMSFQIGTLHWILSALGGIFIFIYFLKNKKITNTQSLLLINIVLALFSLFMTHERSSVIWEKLSLLQKVQFPWRWLNIATLFISISASLSVFELEKNTKLRYITFFSICMIILTNMLYSAPLQQGPLTDQEKFSGKAWQNQVTSGIYDYLPKTARIAPLGPAGNGVDIIQPQDSIKKINTLSGSDWNMLSLELSKPSNVYLSRLDFPGTKVYLNSKLIEHTSEPELGRINLTLPAGNNLIYVKLENTLIRSQANFITMASILLVALILIWKPKTKIAKFQI